MDSLHETSEVPYKGTQDIPSLLDPREWSPNSLFKQPPAPVNRDASPNSQPYVNLIKQLSEKGHPDLKFLSKELQRQNEGTHAERSRTRVLEYSTAGGPPLEKTSEEPFPSSKALQEYLNGTSRASCNRLYILEDISTNYVELFGSHFEIEPSFWALHLRTTDRETSKTAGDVSALPSIRNLDTSFSLIYPEYSVIDDPIAKLTDDPQILDAKSLFADCNLYRKITMIRPGEFYDGIAAVNRRASFWSRVNKGGSWDSLILVDPPLIRTDKEGHAVPGAIIYSHNFEKEIETMESIPISHCAPYQGGYIDFTPVKSRDANASAGKGPPRTSLFDDLIYYHKQPSPDMSSMATPDTAAFFLKNIIAGIWMNSIAYVGTSVSSLEYAVEQSRKHLPSSSTTGGATTSYGGLTWLEKNLFHIYSWKRRCSQLHDWTDRNLQELEASHLCLTTTRSASTTSAATSESCVQERDSLRSQPQRTGSASTSCAGTDQQDWRFIKKRLERCEAVSKDIVASALGLLSLIESHKSVEEAESARVLALLGTVYLPLSLTAGVLSMGGTFTPGQSQFWIFFAVAGPLMILSFGATYTPVLMRKLVPSAVKKDEKDGMRGVERARTFPVQPPKIETV